jgi:phosphatidylglycerol:prolipoprotein diacylglycerol transferase
MYPYIHMGSLALGTFGLLLWLAAVVGIRALHQNFVREGVDADALSIVAMVVIAGVVGAKTWHELQDPAALGLALHQIAAPGLKHPLDMLMDAARWFQAGFAWYGGLLAGIAMLIWQGVLARPNGLRGGRAAMRMLDLAAPATALAYGVGRIGCLTAGDGDYGKNTTLPWGVHMKPDALVPPNPPNALVQPTPIYELIFAVLLFWWLWRRARKGLPLGWLTGEYLVLSGVGRFLVEFERINPRLYLGMSNAQVASLGSIAVGLVIMAIAKSKGIYVAARPSAPNTTEVQRETAEA